MLFSSSSSEIGMTAAKLTWVGVTSGEIQYTYSTTRHELTRLNNHDISVATAAQMKNKCVTPGCDYNAFYTFSLYKGI